MIKKVADNEYWFSVKDNNPFLIFPYLQKVAAESMWKDNVLDLSRWDPGLWFSPSQEWRVFYSFIVAIDTYLNSVEPEYRIHKKSEKDIEEIEKLIEKWAYEMFSDFYAKKNLETFDYIIGKIQEAAKWEVIGLSKFDVILSLFKYSTPVWGCYHSPWWEDIVKIVSAAYYRRFLKDDSIKSTDFVFTSWVNDAIWTLFKLLCAHWINYLKEWDNVAVTVPVYYPYFSEINQRKLNPVEIETDPNTWKTNFDVIENFKWRIKVFFLVTPWNPSWVKYSKEEIEKIVALAKKHDAIIISDEIYARFYLDFDSPWHIAKERTLRLSWKSKIERSPGLRFGHVMISDEANDYISNNLLKDYLDWKDFKTQLVLSKAPWWNFWSFAHTVTVPGPSQVLWMIYNLLWRNERRIYIKKVEENSKLFFDELWIAQNWKIYYWIFNLNDVSWNNKQDIGIDQKLHVLATKYWVILIPAMKFFSDKAQKESDKSNFVRVSLPNLYPEQIKEAVKRIREYLGS